VGGGVDVHGGRHARGDGRRALLVTEVEVHLRQSLPKNRKKIIINVNG
jgi:hypothetical protein